MKILDHGKFYHNSIIVCCDKCRCIYEIKKEDIQKYEKPKKVLCGWIDHMWKEKRYYYSICPECKYDNPINNEEYEILTTNIKGKK